jgi:hypothetical protein
MFVRNGSSGRELTSRASAISRSGFCTPARVSNATELEVPPSIG